MNPPLSEPVGLTWSLKQRRCFLHGLGLALAADDSPSSPAKNSSSWQSPFTLLSLSPEGSNARGPCAGISMAEAGGVGTRVAGITADLNSNQ